MGPSYLSLNAVESSLRGGRLRAPSSSFSFGVQCTKTTATATKNNNSRARVSIRYERDAVAVPESCCTEHYSRILPSKKSPSCNRRSSPPPLRYAHRRRRRRQHRVLCLKPWHGCTRDRRGMQGQRSVDSMSSRLSSLFPKRPTDSGEKRCIHQQFNSFPTAAFADKNRGFGWGAP